MRKEITRTMTVSTIYGYRIQMVENTPKVVEIEPFKVAGEVTPKEALKALKDEFGENTSITINNIVVDRGTYIISVNEFVKHAKKVETQNENKPNNKNERGN